MTKQELKVREKELIEMTQTFCDQMLDNDYKYLCGKLIAKLGRKRDVPFQRGKIEIWAAAVIHALGSVNFLFDKSFQPYVTPEQINKFFGTKSSSVTSKSREIRDMLDLGYFNPEFSTGRMLKENPFFKLAIVDGFIVPK